MKVFKICLANLLVLSIVWTLSLPVIGKPDKGPPDAIQLKKKLKSRPFHEHMSIYREILEDTSVLDHTALQKTLLKVARDGWFKQYLASHLSDESDYEQPDVNPKFLLDTLNLFQEVVQYVPGKRGIKIWLYILPNNQWADRGNLQTKLKASGQKALRLYLSLVDNPNGEKVFNRISSTEQLSRVLFEIYVAYSEQISKNLKKKLEKFAWRTLQNDHGPAKLSVAILLEQGYEKKFIKKKFKQPDVRYTDVYGDEEPYTIPGHAIKNAIFQEAKRWREEYPRWPIDESDPSKPGKNPDGKITICHIPPENPPARHTIKVGKPAVQDHLNHGDYRGACEE